VFSFQDFFAVAGQYFGNPTTLKLLCAASVVGLIGGALQGRWSAGILALMLPFTVLFYRVEMMLTLMIGVLVAIPFGRMLRSYDQANTNETNESASHSSTDMPASTDLSEANASIAAKASVVGRLVLIQWGALIFFVFSVPHLMKLHDLQGSAQSASLLLLGGAFMAFRQRGRVFEGLALFALGLAVGMVGVHQQSGIGRWTFGLEYLKDGIPVLPVILGMLLIPEILMRLWRRGSDDGASVRPDAVAIPLGRELLSKAADLGGGLLAVFAFLVPISAALALILVAFLMQGLLPSLERDSAGAAQAGIQLVWAGLAASAIAALGVLLWPGVRRVIGSILIMIAGSLARWFFLRNLCTRGGGSAFIVTLVMPTMIVGAYLGSRHWEDFLVFAAAGALGWVLRRQGWSRAPFIVGLAIGDLLNAYLSILIARHGSLWELNYMSAIILFVACGLLAWGIVRQIRAASTAPPSSGWMPPLDEGTVLIGLLGLAGGGIIYTGMTLPDDTLSIITYIPGCLLVFASIGAMVLRRASLTHETDGANELTGIAAGEPAPAPNMGESGGADPGGGKASPGTLWAWGLFVLWVGGSLLAVWVIGLGPAAVIFAILYCRFASDIGVIWIILIAIAALLIFVNLLAIMDFPPSMLPPSMWS